MGNGLAPVFLVPTVVLVVFLFSGCASILGSIFNPQYTGEVIDLPLKQPVQVLRDQWGIPHIRAENEEDMMFAQGFIHAQDRLWQMELFRRLTQGRLAEVAGEAAARSDFFIRLVGFHNVQQRAARNITERNLSLIQAYTNGINAFLQSESTNLPIELRLIGIEPERWTVEDCFGVLAAISWFMQSNYIQELLFVEARDKLTRSEWDLLFPPYPGEKHPPDAYYSDVATLDIAPFLPEATSFFDSFFSSSGPEGSNNWAVKQGPENLPCLANDTHMTLMVPNIWYICHLESPGMEVAGFSIAGSPGVFIGHNGKVAWGFTNLTQDAQDLYILEVDPQNPRRYRVGDTWHTMREEEITIKHSKGKSSSFTAYYTQFGPVITEITDDADAVVVLKWYGSLEEEALEDQSTRAFFDLARAETVEGALQAASGFSYLGQNLIAAGEDGRIGYHAFGAVPIRTGYSGRFPALGSGGKMDWIGFIPYEQMPQRLNPAEGYLATANNRVVADRSDAPISFAWSEPYRVSRISALLSELDNPTVEDFTGIQMDIKSGVAEAVLDRVLSYPSNEPLAAEARALLADWDRTMNHQSVPALIFEVFLVEWVKALLEDELGEDFPLYMSAWPSLYSIEDIILDHPDSALWDRKDTAPIETPVEILDLALKRTMTYLSERFGEDRAAWSWGRLHTITFAHPAGTGCIGSRIFNRGPYPAGGSLTTINVGGYLPTTSGFDVAGIPNMRMVVPLSDPDRTVVVSPPGQSGVPFHQHYDDMIDQWRMGRSISFPFSRKAVDRAAVTELLLLPGQSP